MANKMKIILFSLFLLTVGICIGGYLFAQSQPRSVLSLDRSKNILSRRAIAGMLASVGIQNFPGLVPFVVFETDKTIAIKSPIPEAPIDYVIFPKKDLKDIGQISEEDSHYLIDAYLVARYIIEKENLSRYRLYTNGPGFQKVTYLHFHLISKDKAPSQVLQQELSQ